MATFEDNNIQSAINSALETLNAECNGMIEKVWFVNDINDILYRTDEEKGYIREACIRQVQFELNLGLDMTDGSNAFSLGGINNSYQRP
ncbi:MAG: hypothetical protein ACRCYA_04075, partial [Cetobacterium sp.]|uniref:hypothetical protein n=1 Tax=Cetobacterium sp. TaxID=2071632 RepID=UPI003F3A25D3